VAKITDKDGEVTTNRYIRDASGNVMAVYKEEEPIEHHLYGSSRLGLALDKARPGQLKLGHRNYELSNHLGNVLAVITDNVNIVSDEAESEWYSSKAWPTLLATNDYYPFGLGMEGRTSDLGDNEAYRYGFNGQENEDEISGSGNTVDFGERIYSPRIGRFLSADPLIVKQGQYPELSPYQFASLTPIQAIDLDGLEGLIVIRIGDKPPSNFNKTLFASELQKRLIESGAHKDTRVVFENSKAYNDIGAWNRFWDYESNQSAIITIRDMNIVRDAGHTDAGGYGEDGQVVIYRGLVGIKNHTAKDREMPNWVYVNVALHEIGHAVYDFFGNKETSIKNGLGHDSKGDSKDGKDLMDYDVVYKQEADYSDEQKKVIKETAGEDE
jgi:RHS repeat-associated protein